MWLLLVAVGTGCLASCWRKSHKSQSESRGLNYGNKLKSPESQSQTPKMGRSVTSHCAPYRRSNNHCFREKREGSLDISCAQNNEVSVSIFLDECTKEPKKSRLDDELMGWSEQLIQQANVEVHPFYWSKFLPTKLPDPCGDARCDWWRELFMWNLGVLFPFISKHGDQLSASPRPKLLKSSMSTDDSLCENFAVKKCLQEKTPYLLSLGAVYGAHSKSNASHDHFTCSKGPMTHKRLVLPDYLCITPCRQISIPLRDSIKMPTNEKTVSEGSLQHNTIWNKLPVQDHTNEAYLSHKSSKLDSPGKSTHGKIPSNFSQTQSSVVNALLDPQYTDHLPDSHSHALEGIHLSARKCPEALCCPKFYNSREPITAEAPFTAINKARHYCVCAEGGSIPIFGMGVGIGIMLSTLKSRSELGTLISLMKETQTLICNLKKEIDLISVSNMLGGSLKDKTMHMDPESFIPTHQSDWHRHIKVEMSRITQQKSPLDLFDAPVSESIFAGDHVNGIAALEAELEVELQRMELSMYGCASIDFQREALQSNEAQPEVEVDIPRGHKENSDSWFWEYMVNNDANAYNDYGDEFDFDEYYKDADQMKDQIYECHYPVSPRELERRLWPIMEQRHKEHISELESMLQSTNKSLSTKEMEVQWWKDRVWWLMEALSEGKENSHFLQDSQMTAAKEIVNMV